jgi:hypothetical protein
MQTTYYVLVVVALLNNGNYYISPKTPAFPYLELCKMTQETVKKTYRPRKDIKSLITICNPVRFMDEDTGD